MDSKAVHRNAPLVNRSVSKLGRENHTLLINTHAESISVNSLTQPVSTATREL